MPPLILIGLILVILGLVLVGWHILFTIGIIVGIVGLLLYLLPAGGGPWYWRR